ncbi:MAG TPA: glycoside hydrolase domain-containing protein [Byssovorax sp.]|jgi:hypothetical protein
MDRSSPRTHALRPRAALLVRLLAATTPLLAGCASADHVAPSSDGDQVAPLAGAFGCDYSFARPSPAHLEEEGYQFVARYFSYDSGKNLGASEATSLEGAGLAIVSNWEAGGDDALDGFDTGAQEAQDAAAQAQAAGAPGDRPIYFSVDFDASSSQMAAIGSYMDGVASVIGRERTGAYGGYDVIKGLFDAGKITWGWQTYAWSNDQWDPRAQLRQVENGLEGDSIDKDQAIADDIGQWGSSGSASPPPPSQTSACSVHSDGRLYCTDTAGSAMYADPTTSSAVVDHLETTNSWFQCWGTGQLHSGGNTTWYYTQGDDEGAWGWVPAADLDTTSAFDANPTAAGLAACGATAPPPPNGGTTSNGSVASIATANLGDTACGLNSAGGHAYGSSCTGNGGQPEYWCADFAKWVWQQAGADVDNLTAGAGSFYVYGQDHATLSNTPHVGDAVVFDYQGGGYADHVAIVTQVNGSSIVTVSGDWNGQSGSEAHFSSTSSVIENQPAYPGVVGSSPSIIGMTISGFISPVGIPAAAATQTAEGSQAFVYPSQQHFVNRDASGDVRHHFWDASTNAVTTDTWGTGAAGQPVSFVDGTSQHVFARGTDGTLLHWYWDPVNGSGHDDWAPGGGLAGDPAAILIGDYQDVWAVDANANLQHWYWGPSSSGVQTDTWGSGVAGRPSVLVTSSGEQHAFARGTGGTLEHFWWTASSGVQHDTWGSGLAGDPAALAVGDFQDVWGVDAAGSLQHWYWGPSSNGVQHDTWGSGVVGRPSVVVYGNGDQEAFVRGTGGTLEHFWWDASLGVSHDTWGTAIAQDPTAEIIDGQQHVWAADASGHAQHWFWDPTTGMHHDDWGP